MTMSTLVKSFAVALTAGIISMAGVGQGGAATQLLSLTNPAAQSNTPENLVFTATGTQAILIVQGFQMPDIETLADNVVTPSGGGPNLLAPTWVYEFAPGGSNSFTFNDGTSVAGLGFAGETPPNMDTFLQRFATVPGDSYTYSFLYSNDTGNNGAVPSQLLVSVAVPETSIWAMLLLGFAGLGFASYRAHRAAASIA
jgi:hypothetical protein